MPSLSVIICAHNPHPGRLTRTVAGLTEQSLPRDQWELLIIDNASRDQSAFAQLDFQGHPHVRIIREDQLGLTSARLRGFAEAKGEIIVMVDDDNILASDYLANVVNTFDREVGLGAIGGRSLPEFESTPPNWLREFDGMLALREPGTAPARATWNTANQRTYPSCAPIGAGMALRASCAKAYADELSRDARRRVMDRTGTQLISGGDNDLVMTVLETGLAVGYQPTLQLTHLIPTERMQPAYLGALNRAIARSWIRVLALHGIQPWQPVHPITVPLRKLRSWLRTRLGHGTVGWIKWQGTCGHFEGLADLHQSKS